MNLCNKRVLITAGPTWVAIDSVRVISNAATGQTGLLLAERLQRRGAKVTLLLGPVALRCQGRGVRILRFNFFDELKELIRKELTSKKYDIFIHSAAVCDYKPLKSYTYKVKSGLKNWRLNLVPTEKIIERIKKYDHSLFLVGFKFRPDANKSRIIKDAKTLIRRAGLNLTVANTVNHGIYRAYILLNNGKTKGPFLNKSYLVRALIGILGDNLCRN